MELKTTRGCAIKGFYDEKIYFLRLARVCQSLRKICALLWNLSQEVQELPVQCGIQLR